MHEEEISCALCLWLFFGYSVLKSKINFPIIDEKYEGKTCSVTFNAWKFWTVSGVRSWIGWRWQLLTLDKVKASLECEIVNAMRTMTMTRWTHRINARMYILLYDLNICIFISKHILINKNKKCTFPDFSFYSM